MKVVKREVALLLRDDLRTKCEPKNSGAWKNGWKKTVEMVWMRVEKNMGIILSYGGTFDCLHNWFGSVK